MKIRILLLIMFGLTVKSMPASACTCVPPPPDLKTPRHLVERAAKRSDAIFEGKVESAELKWRIAQAKLGEVVSADFDDDPPLMRVSFDVMRDYKGTRGKHIQVTTGLGGGDCGVAFEISKQYLVYSHIDESGEFSTNICSGTAPLDESQTGLANLRGDPDVPDVATNVTPNSKTKLCGSVTRSAPIRLEDSQVYLLSAANRSPIPSDEADLASDGSFCFSDVPLGEYQLLFVERLDESPLSFAYFPGVVDRAEATLIHATVDQAASDLVFRIPSFLTHSVSGRVAISTAPSSSSKVQVALISASEPLSLLAYGQDVASNGTFTFPRVLPGKYWALVNVDGDESKWSTRKVEVQVKKDVANLSLELIPN